MKVIIMIFIFNKYYVDKQVFPNYDFLGWYSTGFYPTKYDIMCQQQVICLFIYYFYNYSFYY